MLQSFFGVLIWGYNIASISMHQIPLWQTYKTILDICYHYGTIVCLLPQSGCIVKIQGHRYIVTVGIGRIQDTDGYMAAYNPI